MVILHVKHGDESQFLLETTVNTPIEDIVNKTVMLYNGKLKINRLCSEIELLMEHGPSVRPEMHGLTDDQISELKLKDEYVDKCEASGGFQENKDPCGKRNGHQPVQKMQDVLRKTISEAKGMVSKELVKSGICLTEHHIYEAVSILRGAIMIVYPMNLPPYDPVRLELENREDLSSSVDIKQVLEPAMTQLWFAGKELQCGKKLSSYVGNNEKSKIIVKVQRRGQMAPAREPLLTEEERKNLLLAEFKRREEMKKLVDDDDDSHLDSPWADNQMLKKSFQGLTDIKWKPH